MPKADDFVFKEWCSRARLRQATVDLLEVEAYNDEITLPYLHDDELVRSLNLPGGEAIRLKVAVKNTFPDKVSDLKQEHEQSILQEAGWDDETESPPVAAGKGSTVSKPLSGAADAIAAPHTTKTLARDKDLNANVDRYLHGTAITGVKDLLTLREIQNSAVESSTRGEQSKPLLIGDFITSNINVSYVCADEEVKLSDSTKLVVEGRSKKPSIVDYTSELWSSANSRILQHLLRSGANLVVLSQYIEFTAIISDYLALYIKRGVFLLDFEHRMRVAAEGKPWNEISRHDKDRFLVFAHDHNSLEAIRPSDSQPKRSANKSRRLPRRKTLDSAGIPVCYNYNMRKGCDTEHCTYSHSCSNCLVAGHTSFDCKKTSAAPRFRKL